MTLSAIRNKIFEQRNDFCGVNQRKATTRDSGQAELYLKNFKLVYSFSNVYSLILAEIGIEKRKFKFKNSNLSALFLKVHFLLVMKSIMSNAILKL